MLRRVLGRRCQIRPLRLNQALVKNLIGLARRRTYVSEPEKTAQEVKVVVEGKNARHVTVHVHMPSNRSDEEERDGVFHERVRDILRIVPLITCMFIGLGALANWKKITQDSPQPVELDSEE